MFEVKFAEYAGKHFLIGSECSMVSDNAAITEYWTLNTTDKDEHTYDPHRIKRMMSFFNQTLQQTQEII